MKPLDFEEFWRAYPRKIGKIKAQRCWNRMREMDKRKCMEGGLEKWVRSGDWLDIQFVPYPATFLNQRRYEEEPTFPGMFRPRQPAPDYSAVVEAEVAKILKRHPDLA